MTKTYVTREGLTVSTTQVGTAYIISKIHLKEIILKQTFLKFTKSEKIVLIIEQNMKEQFNRFLTIIFEKSSIPKKLYSIKKTKSTFEYFTKIHFY